MTRTLLPFLEHHHRPLAGLAEEVDRRRFPHVAVVGLVGTAKYPAHRLLAQESDVTTGPENDPRSSVRQIAAVRYAPPGRYMKDHCFVRRNNRWHLFAPLGKVGTSSGYGTEETAEHMVSDDLVHWEHLGTAVDASRRDGHFDKMMGGIAPHVIEHDGKFWMFYAGWTFPASVRIST